MRYVKPIIAAVIIGTLAWAAPGQSGNDAIAGANLAELSNDELSSVVGSMFARHCPDAANTACPGRGSCNGVTCIQHLVLGWPAGCSTSGGTTGCTQAGNYIKCVWAWCWWCSQDGVARCGNKEYPYCTTDSSGLWCTGYCVLQQGGTCKRDCT